MQRRTNTRQYIKSAGRRLTARSALIVIAILCIAYGLWGLIQRFTATHNPKPTISHAVIRHSTEHPDETPPNVACDNYKVPADQPRKIDLPALGVSGCIQRVGVDALRRIAVPLNVHLAGWYVDSSLPGENGVSIINGHVQGLYQPGLFKHLNEVQVGDAIRVQFGDNSWREFTVVSLDRYPVDQAASEQFRKLSGINKQLTLVTCQDYSPKSKTYQKRLLVRAQRNI